MQRTIAQHTTQKPSQKGFAAGFWQGRAYILDDPSLERPKHDIGHHAKLLLVYMRLLLHLERSFVMPDVDFVISTIDRPLVLSLNASSSDEPVFRFCKTESSPDVLIPIFHFHTKDYDNALLKKTSELSAQYPWNTKKEVLFGRFTGYSRHNIAHDPAVPPRMGAYGANICRSTRLTTECAVRMHFVQWSKKFPDEIDVSEKAYVSMFDHARYKYLVHLDGQGLSSRLEQLLPLGSLVVKEESGYRAFYHHLLKPHEHYVPFWRRQPDEVLDVLKWAKGDDLEVQRIASNGQQLAVRYLNQEARTCYWYHLLTEFSKLLRYKPGKVAGRKYMQYYMPVEEYLQTVGRAVDGGKAWVAVEKFMP